MISPKIAVIGGGAAGFFGAIACTERFPDAAVTIFEATRQPLYKVGISGGGRCNVTHHCSDPGELVEAYPRGGKELIGPFTRFQPRDTVEWFKQHGVRLKTEDDGRMFPVTDDSATIVNCLQESAVRAGVILRTGARVVSIRRIAGSGTPSTELGQMSSINGDAKENPPLKRWGTPRKRTCETASGRTPRTSEMEVATHARSSVFEIKLKSGEVHHFGRVLLATGSGPAGYKFAQGLGHTIVPLVPSLFTFQINDSRLRDFAGMSFPNVRLELLTPDGKPLEQTGPVLITHWGLSGPAVLRLSAWGARILFTCRYHADLEVNWLPDDNVDSLIEAFHLYREAHPTRNVSKNNFLAIPGRYWARVVELSGVSDETTWSHMTKEGMRDIAGELTQAHFKIVGKGEFKDEFVTCGGVMLTEVDFRTMESRICPGLYLAGEILDIDGITGGYNFQSAWTTGWIAGSNMER